MRGFGLGGLYFCEGRFASFAVLGPFTNGPYGVGSLLQIGVLVVWVGAGPSLSPFLGCWLFGVSRLGGHPLLAFSFAPPYAFGEGGGPVTDLPLSVAPFVLRTFPPRAGETRPPGPSLGLLPPYRGTGQASWE